MEKVEYIQEPRCKKCGKPIRYEEGEYCYDCERNDLRYQQGKSIWLHKDNVKRSIYQFKYNNRRSYGKFYARELCRLYGEKLKEWEIDVIIPVPLHRARRHKRGYNQAEVLAKYLGRETGILVEGKAVRRIGRTRPQKELSHRERQKNLSGVFKTTKRWKKWKHVLIVDDIYTTGSTIDSLTRELMKKGADKVWFFTISIGQGF